MGTPWGFKSLKQYAGRKVAVLRDDAVVAGREVTFTAETPWLHTGRYPDLSGNAKQRRKLRRAKRAP